MPDPKKPSRHQQFVDVEPSVGRPVPHASTIRHMKSPKSKKMMRLAIAAFAATIVLSVVTLVSLRMIPTEIKNPIDAGFAPLWRPLILALVALSMLNAVVGCVMVFYSKWLTARDR